MPLIDSDSNEALQKNIATEIKSGTPKDQAIAIALDIQKKAKARKNKAKHEDNPELQHGEICPECHKAMSECVCNLKSKIEELINKK